MADKLPSLNALKAFDAAARAGSFTRAASELNVTHAAISRHIRDLELDLRCQLFVRTGRGVELTEPGAILARDLTTAFSIITTATGRFARPNRRRPRLMISSDLSFATLWLVPRLGRFTAAYPDIDVVIDPNPRLIDFDKEDFDFGIRFGGADSQWRGVQADRLIHSALSLVASPALLRTSPLQSPADLRGSLLIQETAKEYWRTWLTAAKVANSIVPSGPTLNGDLAIAAAEAGQGFALADCIQAGDALLAKRLVAPFDIVVGQHAYFLVSRSDKKPSKAASQFKSWLLAEMCQTVADLARLKEMRGMRAKPPRGKTAAI